MKKIFLLATLCFISNVFLYASDNSNMQSCSFNKYIDLTLFKNQKNVELLGSAKDDAVSKALKREKIQHTVEKYGTPIYISVFKTSGLYGAKKHTFVFMFDEKTITYIIAEHENKTHEFFQEEKQSFRDLQKRDQYDDAWLDVIGGYVPRPDDIDNVSCTGCAGTGESQDGRTAKATELKIDDSCFNKQYQSCAADPNCDSGDCLAACYAGSKAYCTYSEAYCRQCVYIPSYTEHMGNIIW